MKLAKRYYDSKKKRKVEESQVLPKDNNIEELVVDELRDEKDTEETENDGVMSPKETTEDVEDVLENIESTTGDAEEEETTGDAEEKEADTIIVEEDRMEEEWTLKMTTLYRFIHQIIMVLLRECDNTESQCVQFTLMAGQSADYCEFDSVAYNFFLDAFKMYEESVSHSKAQFNAIVYSIGSLLSTSKRLRENQQQYYTILSTKITLYCTKLLKKPDQSRSIYLSSHLWVEEAPQRVLECLQKSLKIADSCMDIITNELLFLELLNQYIYYYEKENPLVRSVKSV